MASLAGVDALVRKLADLKDSTSKKIAKAGVNAALGALAKRERAAVNGSGVSQGLKKAARETIGKRLKKASGQAVGKAGFAVGKPSKRKREKAADRAKDKGRRGVGISASNIHWAVLGTGQRKTKRHATGVMPPSLHGLIEKAATGAEGEMLAAAAAKMRTVLEREAAKRA